MRSGQMVAGRYRLEELIGSGGMGVVWRAVDTELDRVVAVKHAKPGNGSTGAEQLLREAKNAARVLHPHAVTLFDAVREGAEVWLVMEYLPAESLAALLDREGRLEPRRAARIGAQIADALAAMHAGGVVHRDVKPGNVLVTEHGVAKLTDFGVSRWTEETLTHTGPVVGTPAYLAPEIVHGREATPASDVFSLGATLFAAVEGTRPVSADPSKASREVPTTGNAGPLGPVLGELLAVRPSRRPSADAARRALVAVSEDTTIPAGLPPAGKPAARRQFGLLPRIAVAAVVAAVATWLLVSSVDQPANGTPVAALVGDPRSVDPCALVDPRVLGRFGRSEVDTDYGGFNRCDVLVAVSKDAKVDVEVHLDKDDERSANGAGRGGVLGVDRPPGDAEYCDRVIRLAEPYRIVVAAKTSDPVPVDLCAMADTATDSALAVLRRGPVPRRATPPPDGSLFNVDACGLLRGSALDRLPGVDAVHPESALGNWACRWRSTTGPTTLRLVFDRNEPLTAEDGRPIRLAGRDAFVAMDDDRTCVVRVVYRQYRNELAHDAEELLLVEVAGDQPAEQLCAMATDLAASAATNLPAPKR